MNSIKFYVNMSDDVIMCEYIEEIDGYRYDLITLPLKELHEFLKSSLKKYGEPIEEIKNEEVTVLTFKDVDVDEIDQIVKRSNDYKKKIAEDTLHQLRGDPDSKIVRKNKFKKAIVRTSTTLLAILVMYSTAKEINKSISISDISLANNHSYDSSLFLEFDNNDEIFPSNMNNYNTNIYLEDTQVSVLNNVNDELSNISNDLNSEDENIEENTSVMDESKLEEEFTLDEQDNNPIEITPDIVFSLDTDDWTDTEKYYVAKAYYYDTIARTAKTYGIDPQLALAIGIHERGLHSEHVDSGGAIGLFQIQVEGNWNWDGKQITAYNFDRNESETITITRDDVSDVFKNIQVGCMMIQNGMINNNYNLLLGVTEHNYGNKWLGTVLESCSAGTGYSIDELRSMDNIEWLNYRSVIHGGDPNYLENVFKYIPSGTILTFTKPNGEVIHMLYNNSRTLEHHL